MFDFRLGVHVFGMVRFSHRLGFLYSVWLYATVAVADGC